MRTSWLRPLLIIGGILAGVGWVGSAVRNPFFAADPLPGTTKHTPVWIVEFGGVMAFGALLGLGLLMVPVVVYVCRRLTRRLRWRLGHWPKTGSPLMSGAEKPCRDWR